jgi:NIMA (never in mitosis gene a)-related kinase 1/4/5
MMHEPPFKADNMDKLYKKILRGKMMPIDSEYGYSDDLITLIKLMLKVDIKLRPTASQILEYPIVKEMEEVYLGDVDKILSGKYVEEEKFMREIQPMKGVYNVNYG